MASDKKYFLLLVSTADTCVYLTTARPDEWRLYSEANIAQRADEDEWRAIGSTFVYSMDSYFGVAFADALVRQGFEEMDEDDALLVLAKK